MPGEPSPNPEVLLALMPWDLPEWFTETVSAINPSIKILSHRCGMYDKVVPPEISEETWASVTVFFTWNALPTKKQVPRLRYVQLLSAGCNHVSGNPLFEETDIDFCTANGVHPYDHPVLPEPLYKLTRCRPQIAEWIITTFLSFQHHSK